MLGLCCLYDISRSSFFDFSIKQKKINCLIYHVYTSFSHNLVCVGVDTDGGSVNGSEDSSVCYPDLPICLPCWPGCRSCQDGTPCWVQEAWLLRATVLAVQGVFMLLIFVSMLVAYRHRRNRVSQGFLALEGHHTDGMS